MSYSNYFLSKLPAGHGTTLLTKQTATALLLADTLVLPSFSYNGMVPELRELCAAALVGSLTALFGTGNPTATDCSSQYSVSAVKHSFVTERDRGTV